MTHDIDPRQNISDPIIDRLGYDHPETKVILGVALLDPRDPELITAMLKREFDQLLAMPEWGDTTPIGCLKMILGARNLYGRGMVHYQMTDDVRAALQAWYWEHRADQAAYLARAGVDLIKEWIVRANKRTRALRYFRCGLQLACQLFARAQDHLMVQELLFSFLSRPDTDTQMVYDTLRDRDLVDERFAGEVTPMVSRVPVNMRGQQPQKPVPGNQMNPAEDLMDDVRGDHNKSVRSALVGTALFDFGEADPNGLLLAMILSMTGTQIQTYVHELAGLSTAELPCQIEDPALRDSLREWFFREAPLQAFQWVFFSIGQALSWCDNTSSPLEPNEQAAVLERIIASMEVVWHQFDPEDTDPTRREHVVDGILSMKDHRAFNSALSAFEGDAAYIQAIRDALATPED